MRLLHAVLLSVVIVLALDVGLLQARALDDDETDVSAGDVHPSRETAIDEESRSNFIAKFKSFFGKSSSASTTTVGGGEATAAKAAQKLAARQQKANAKAAKAARVEAARLANERAAAEKSMHSEIDKLVENLNKAINLHDKKGVKIKFFSSKEYQRALKYMVTVNSGRGANDKLNMFKILEEKMGKEGLTGLATTIAAKGGGHDQMAASALTTFLKQSEEAMPLSGGTRTLADRKKADALRVIV